MLTGVHLLLTYSCNYECDHCFLFCTPHSAGTFSHEQLQRVIEQLEALGTIEWVFFEGGEPFLYYPLMLAGLQLAHEKGLKTGVVTNAYWANTPADARLWLEPLQAQGVASLSVSDDLLHYPMGKNDHGQHALMAAGQLGILADAICIEKPQAIMGTERTESGKGKPIIGGGVRFRGRAADKLSAGLPRRPWQELTTCPHEELADPGRVHIDAYGHVHLCQGLSLGNIWQTPLKSLIEDYQPERHPICGPLLRGGPAQLAKEYDMTPEYGYIEECHMCYRLRRMLLDDFSQYLVPRQVYGLC